MHEKRIDYNSCTNKCRLRILTSDYSKHYFTFSTFLTPFNGLIIQAWLSILFILKDKLPSDGNNVYYSPRHMAKIVRIY